MKAFQNFKILLFLNVLLYFLHSPAAHAQSNNNPCRMRDSLILVDLYNATNGANWTTTWDLNQPMKTWYGIVLNEEGCVTCIDLDNIRICTDDFMVNSSVPGNNLEGTLPASITNLSELEHLNLAQSQISGPIPSDIGNLSKLKYLILAINPLEGTIPASIVDLTNLEVLLLFDNNLTGPLPSSIGNLTNLTRLAIGQNNMSGPIPNSIGNLVNLTGLSLGEADFDGTLPDFWTNLPNLESLALNNCEYTGTIPASLGTLDKLIRLDLSSNNLTGAIPSELGNMTILRDLFLEFNQLGGEIPEELGDLSNLEFLRLHSNQLEGAIPTELGNLSKLEFLTLNNNNLEGSIPSSLGNLDSLLDLRLDNNQLTSTIPTSLGNLQKLDRLRLYANNLHGNIPPELGNLLKLRFLQLNGNNLTGPIPGKLSNLTELINLQLQGNNLEGIIPPSLGNLTNLEFFSVAANNLTGNVPKSLGNLTKLTSLRLENNQLSGSLPKELANLINVDFLRLDNNNLLGCFPSEYTALCALRDSAIIHFFNNPELPGGGDINAFCTSSTGGCSFECNDALPLMMSVEPCVRNSETVFLANASTSILPPEGNCVNTFAGNDVWFTAIVPASGNFLMQINDQTTIVPVVEVFSGGCGILQSIQCAVLEDFPQILIVDTLLAGDTVYFRIWDKNSAVVDVNPDAKVEVSLHALPANQDEWVICDFPSGQSAGGSQTGSGKRSATQFIVQYGEDATPSEIDNIRDDLISFGSQLVDKCECRTTPIELWKAINPIDLEERKREAQTRNSKVDTITYNYLVENLPCVDTLREFQVNTTETGVQINADIAMNDNGEFVVVWKDPSGILGQRYRSDSSKKGNEFTISSISSSESPKVGMDNQGNFVVIWERDVVDAGYTVFGQIYNRDGNPVGEQLVVSGLGSRNPRRNPDLAMNANGTFTVVFEDKPDSEISTDINARSYLFEVQENGISTTIEGPIFQVNSTSFDSHITPAIDLNDSGAFVVTWVNIGALDATFAKYYNNISSPLEFQVSPEMYTYSSGPDVALHVDGSFTVVFRSSELDEIIGKRYDVNGTELQQFTANTFTTGNPNNPGIAGNANGGFTVVWESFGQDGTGSGIYGQRFDENGGKLDNEFRINTSTDGAQENPTIAMRANGDFTVAWNGTGDSGDQTGIHAQRYQNVVYDDVSYAVPLAGNSPCLGIPGEQIPTPAPPIYQPSNPQSRVRVAVLDTGVEDNHNRLQNAIWMNDDPMEGCVMDDIIGYDFVNDDGTPEDLNGHGTAVNGVIAGNFPTDIQLELMNLKFHEGSEGTVFDAVCAIYYAVEEGADVINLSWGFESQEFPTILSDAIAKAYQEGVLVVTSAGNTGKDNDAIKKYPANFDFDNIITVTAFEDEKEDPTPRLAYYASFGSTTVDLAARGYLETATLQNTVGAIAGTSVATPQVTRTVAILKGLYPALSFEDIKTCILNSVQTESNFSGKVATGGILNHLMALDCAATKAMELECANENLSIPEYLNTDVVYKSEARITSTSRIEPGVNAILNAANEVVLKSGFHAKAGATFRAIIQGCSLSDFQQIENADLTVRTSTDTLISSKTHWSLSLSDFTVAPNPFHESATIQIRLPKAGPLQLTVHDVNGRLLTQVAQLQADVGMYQTSFHAGNLNPGVYYLRLQTTQGIFTKKIVHLIP